MDSWQSDLHRARILLKDLSRMASERDRKRRQGGAAGAGSGARARSKLQEVNAVVDQLDSRLRLARRDPTEYDLTDQECDRRRGLLADVKRDRDRISRQFSSATNSYGSVSRDALYAAGAETRMPQNYAGRDLEADGTRGLSRQELLRRQDETFKRQDEALDEISGVVTDIKNLGVAIGEGVDLTTALIGDANKGADATSNMLQKKTQKAKSLRRRVGANCRYYLCILLLIVVLALNIYSSGFCDWGIRSGC